MAGVSRSQLIVYGAIVVVILFVGAKWVSGSADSAATDDGAVAFASSAEQSGGQALEGAVGGRDALVHVVGAVRKGGVYRLPDGARVADAVERAGGPSGRADLSRINLAARLSDGQQVVVPLRNPASADGGVAAVSPAGDESPINLGSATLEQLESIQGIGPVTAAGIIEFRDQGGGLSSIDELDEVSGIGPATLEALRGRLQP